MLDDAHLSAYLHDHMAGAESAIGMLAHRVEVEPDAALQRVLDEIREDRRVLEELIADLGLTPGSAKQAVGWVAERVLRVGRDASRALSGIGGVLELEVLQLGIGGKRALWVMLCGLADHHPRIADLPLEDLIARADAQASVVEDARLAAGRTVLTTTPGTGSAGPDLRGPASNRPARHPRGSGVG